MTKVSYSMITGAPVNALDYGVDPSGTTDSAAALQAALNACLAGQYVEISGSIRLNSQVVLPATCGGIIGQGMGITTITYTKEQPMPSPVYDGSQCAIVASGVDNVVFQDFSLVYTGTYYVAGDSYFGVVSGLYIKDCDNVIVRRVEATGFNCTGIQFTSASSSALSFRNIIEDCYSHHNRQAGCYVDKQKLFTARGNRFEYNGDARDGGTGYGFSANTGGNNEDLLVTENQTYRNYRKGIDFHDGLGVVCTDNVCIEDRIHGIFYENTTTNVSNVLIANNYIKNDPDFYVAAPAEPYNFYRGISVYLVSHGTAQDPNVTIVGNILSKIYKNRAGELVYPLLINDQTGQRTLVNVSKNTIRGGDAQFGILVEQGTIDGELTANIEGNEIVLGDLANAGIIVDPQDSDLAGNGGYAQIINNTIQAVSSVDPFIRVPSGFKTVNVSDNSAFITTLSNSFIYVGNTVNSQVSVKNNKLNLTNDSYADKIVYGSQLVTQAQNNIVDGAEQIDTLRIATTAGSTKRYVGAKSLAASTLTDLIRLVQQYTQGYYKVKWSAWYNDAQPATATAGGEFVFVGAWSDNGQITSSSLTALSALSSNNGAPAITNVVLTWALVTDLSSGYSRKLQVTSNVNCSLYFEIEAVMSMDQTTVSPLVLL